MQVYSFIHAGARVRVPVVLSALALTAWLTPTPDALARPATDEAAAHPGGSLIAGLPAQVGQVPFEQHSRRGSSGGGGGQATPRGGSGGGSGSSGGSSGGGRSSGGSSGGGSTSGGPSTGSPRTRSGSGSDGSSGTATARPRDGRPVEGTAVERRDGGASSGGDRDRDRTVIVGGRYGGFYPWGWGGLGLGGYYGGYYDPWGWGGWGGYDPYGPYGPSRRYWSGNEGSLRLRVAPRQAEVYVDGYYAGSVDDYDGTFQRLRLEPGPHRIEVRLDGYEPLSFEVRIPPGRTVTFRGTLERDDRDDRDDRDARDDNR